MKKANVRFFFLTLNLHAGGILFENDPFAFLKQKITRGGSNKTKRFFKKGAMHSFPGCCSPISTHTFLHGRVALKPPTKKKKQKKNTQTNAH